MTQPVVVYGALYLDRGEPISKAYGQINSLKKKAKQRGVNVGLYFDVLHGPGCREEALDVVRRIEERARREFPNAVEIRVSATEARDPDHDPRQEAP